MADFRPPGQRSAVLTMKSIFILLQFVFLSGACIPPRVRVEIAFQFLASFPAQLHNGMLVETLQGHPGRTRAAQRSLGRNHRVAGPLELDLFHSAASVSLLALFPA